MSGEAHLTGRTIGHFRILEKVGRGGMGVVYKARDLSLDRFVALKFLPAAAGEDPSALARLKLEARAASSLDHPNICTIHEIASTPEGETFIAMAFYEGETLRAKIRRGPLEEKAALDLASQMAKALAAAHRHGIVHRDVKPANAIVTPEGTLKVLDFGLAKMAAGDAITQTGMTVGTYHYMSPEQARGGTVDARSDMWAWAVILFEMLTGRLPFRGESAAVMHAIAYDAPDLTPLEEQRIDARIRAVIERALEKHPADRFKDMNEALAILESIRTGVALEAQSEAAARRPNFARSIAVLPFRNLSSDPDDEYFSDGLAEEILNVLTNLDGLDVASRSASFQFRGEHRETARIAAKLNVGLILDGSVRRAGKRLRVSVQLVDAATDRGVWSDRYDGDMDDLFAIQDQVSERIMSALRAKLGDSTRSLPVLRRYTENLAAYNCYLRGRYHYNHTTLSAILKAIAAFEEAVREDPAYVLPWVGIADSYIVRGWQCAMAPREAWAKARLAAMKALELAPDLAEAHSCLGAVLAVDDLDWTAAERRFLRAIELNPDSSHPHHWYAMCVLSPLGRDEEAMREIELAVKLEPLSLNARGSAAWIYYLAENYEAAVDAAEKTLELDPDHFQALWCLASALREVGRHQDSMAALQKMQAFVSDEPVVLGAKGHLYVAMGRQDLAREMLRQLEEQKHRRFVSPLFSAWIYAGLGEFDPAFQALEAAFEARDYTLRSLQQSKALKPLRSDPRFADLVRRLGLHAGPAAVETVTIFRAIS